MLVLSRKKNQGIILTTPAGERIRVVLVELRGDKARIGIEAPFDVEVNRDEIQHQIDNGYDHYNGGPAS